MKLFKKGSKDVSEVPIKHSAPEFDLVSAKYDTPEYMSDLKATEAKADRYFEQIEEFDHMLALIMTPYMNDEHYRAVKTDAASQRVDKLLSLSAIGMTQRGVKNEAVAIEGKIDEWIKSLNTRINALGTGGEQTADYISNTFKRKSNDQKHEEVQI